jgi:hypothetical protein
MTAEGDRRLGLIFGVIAAALLIVDAVLRFLVGILFLATDRRFAALGSVDSAVIFLVIGLVIGFFAILGRGREADRGLAVGIILIVLALVGLFALGFANSVLAILAAVFALVAGILFLAAGR